ncbi:glycosyltransferase family 4 protein [Micromonospora sp. NBC_01813]|uniref:glycosyltransferase family 4 protein n=1 Tax=Micromonospora sp. NBC_01813 TaxID=2975988 RepID=UPI002DDA6636|nr:glycosyltransferase family 4 protein [Micromonospora sp. NBC_01813]WSA11607.1 glycosyltransferase family 4 protein [Micromonospora sp. NBC_01813]
MHVLISIVGKRTEHWTSLFSAIAARPGVRLTVLTADVSDTTLSDLQRLAQRQPNLRYHVLSHRVSEERTGHMASILFARSGLREVAARSRPDVIHIIGEPAYLSTWQMLRLRQRHWPHVPVTVYAAQNVVTRFPLPFPYIEQRTYQSIDHVLPITPAALNVLRVKGYRGRSSVVPLGVDTEAFQPAAVKPRRPFTAGFVGRLERHKGIGDLITAAELVDCDLLVVGDGSMRPEVERAAVRRPGRVTLGGWADHQALPELLHRMDALVLPSIELVQRNVLPWIGIPLREQFGRVLVEAMASGVPPVGSTVGEIPWVIGRAGLTFPPQDVGALAQQLGRLRDDSELARELARHGVHRARTEFGWDRIAASMCRVWAMEAGGPAVDHSDDDLDHHDAPMVAETPVQADRRSAPPSRAVPQPAVPGERSAESPVGRPAAE